MFDNLERRQRLVRWWIGTGSSLVVLGFGVYLLLMRYAFGHNPLRERYWLITGLVLGFGALRLGGQLWRRRYLLVDSEKDNSAN